MPVDEDHSFDIAKCNNPYIRILQTDSNEGVRWLTKKANNRSHWMVFMDPAGVKDLRKETIQALTDRGNSDILINFQTTGVSRAAGADHSKERVTELGGGDWPEDGNRDEYVRWFKEFIETDSNYKTTSRKVVAEGDKRSRFDLIFASAHKNALRIMDEIMSSKLREEITDEISAMRKEHGQQGLENYDIQYTEHDQHSLFDF